MFTNPLLIAILTVITHIHSEEIINEYKQNEKSTVEIVQGYGYGVKVHRVVTPDKYVLELHHIFKNRDGKEPSRNYPVLIPNVLMGSSADWVIAGPERSLPMQLSDDGYDVWLGNYRGNTYCREHKELSSKKKTFWNFSMHELGVKDLPAIIDFILNETNSKKLHFIGFSMSTTIFLIMASDEPVYQTKIKSTTLMAPVANIIHTTSTAKYVALLSKYVDSISKITNNGGFLTDKKTVATVLKYFCDTHKLQKLVCLKLLVFDSCGKDPYYLDEKLILLIFEHYPAGTSSKLVKHYSQSIMTERFGQYDYGRKKNLTEYGSEYPPEYELKKINIPIVLMYSENDLLANPRDVKKLELELPNVADVIRVGNRHFNHVDFLLSINVNEEVNDPTRKILHKADTEVDEEYRTVVID